MASTSSFDVTTGVDYMEVHNALDQATKEVTQRYDFKGAKVALELSQKDKTITLSAPDDFKLKAVIDIIQQKLAKRKVPLKNFTYGAVTPAVGATVRQEITIQSGIPVEKCKEIVKTLNAAYR